MLLYAVVIQVLDGTGWYSYCRLQTLYRLKFAELLLGEAAKDSCGGDLKDRKRYLRWKLHDLTQPSKPVCSRYKHETA